MVAAGRRTGWHRRGRSVGQTRAPMMAHGAGAGRGAQMGVEQER